MSDGVTGGVGVGVAEGDANGASEGVGEGVGVWETQVTRRSTPPFQLLSRPYEKPVRALTTQRTGTLN